MMILFRKLKLALFSTFLCLLLTSCIIVEDIGTYWGSGEIDTSLQGSWSKDSSGGGDCFSFIPDGSDYRVVENGKKEEYLSRTLDLENSKFLMLRDMNSKYLLIRYKVITDDLTIYMLDKTKKSDFLRNYPDSNIIFSNDFFLTATISHLNDESVSLLRAVASDEKYWSIQSERHRVKECKDSYAKY